MTANNNHVINRYNELQILHPKQQAIKEYLFEETIITTKNNRINTKTTTKNVKICFSGIENNKWRYQLLCVALNIEAKHIGSTTILKKQVNVFDELIVHVNQNGTIIDVLNVKDIQKRWQKVKEELTEKHQGSVLLDFIADADEVINNKVELLKHINSKEMYGLYFNNFWGYHDITKPRFEGLILNIEKRIMYDHHTQHLQKPYNNNVKMIFNKTTEQKTHDSFFEYKDHQLLEAYLEVNELNINSKYSLVCLTL